MTEQDKTDFIQNKMEDLDNMGLPDECVAMVRDVVEELADEAESIDLANKDLAVAREMLDAKDAELSAMAKTLAERDALCESQTRTIHGIPALMRERDAAIAAKEAAEAQLRDATDGWRRHFEAAESREHALGVQVVAMRVEVERLRKIEAAASGALDSLCEISVSDTAPYLLNHLEVEHLEHAKQALHDVNVDAVPGDALATPTVDYREASGVDVERVSVERGTPFDEAGTMNPDPVLSTVRAATSPLDWSDDEVAS